MTERERTYQDAVNQQTRREVEAFENDPVAKGQTVLDRWWSSQRAFDRELSDEYPVGGFLERHSAMPSFHKSRRDQDWRAR